MSNETKTIIEKARVWFTTIALGAIAFFLVRLIAQSDDTTKRLYDIKTDVEILKVKVQRIETDVNEINGKIEK